LDLRIIGSKDEKNDDKEIINTSLKSLQNIKYTSGTLTIGNVEIFNLLISKLDIPKALEVKIIKTFLEREIF
jgi:ATP phosphoribosyltransferase regulatory subunit